MTPNICNNCGGDYDYRNGRWKCRSCGSYKPEELSNEEVTLLYTAFQKLRLTDFNEAEREFDDIITKYPKNPNAYWGRLMSRYGIKYEETFDGKKIPTCYASIKSVISDKDYAKAVSLADADTKEYYTQQGEYIERVRKEWIEKARKEKPYDIFISYKDSDYQNRIERTKDSIAAQDLYIHLTGKGYRVFFSRESLRDKVGEKYEPYIFNALSTAKVMIVYGSSSEYVTSTWVKNEWMRYEKKIQAGDKKQNSLIVACDGLSPSELPKALSSMQCLDATKRSFYEDLDKAIEKITKIEEKTKELIVENKTTKKLPIAISLCAVLVAVLLCILIPNSTNQEITSLANSYYGISVDADRDVFPKGTELTVEEILSGEKYDMVQLALSEKAERFKIYDIELVGKKTIDINGTVTVKIPLPNDMSTTGISVYYISDKGVTERLDCSVAEGYVTFKTTHFSIYVIVEDKPNKTGFEYKVNSNGTVTINKYTGSETTVVIPQTIEGKAVTEISSLAFDSLDRITSVNIPETVTTIGAKAFYGCTSISTITIPETVTSIGTSAFYGWGNSQEIVLKGRKEIPSNWNSQWNGSCNAKITYGLATIIFHSNDGSGTTSNQLVEINSSAMVNENKFILSGYTFAGWAATENGEIVVLDKGTYEVAKEQVYHLYAVWSANENKVIFNSNSGNGEMDSQTIHTDDKRNLSKCLFTKEGYTFDGWATTQNGSVVYSDGGLYTMGSDAEYTLYAIWIPNNNELIFNSNGGYGSMDSITVDTNETINLPQNIFILDGYTFIGWSEVQDGAVKYTDEQSFTMSSSATITLYAVWRANENELTFNSNDGTNNENSINLNTGATSNLPSNTFTRNGYTFLGWSTTANGTVEFTNEASYTMGSVSTTLYAVWSANENKIVFNANGGSGTMDFQTIKTDSSDNLNNCMFENNGYVFAGWATAPMGDVLYTNGASYTMGADSEYTLYAIWTTADYRITYELNGGTNNSSNPTGFDINDIAITLAEPTRAGYTFSGWFLDKGFQNASNTIPSGSTGNKTFYASWSANENTLHFNANGGDGSIADMNIKTDASAALKENTLTREGYAFAGWSTIADGGVDFEDGATYTMGADSEYTLYAVWEIISYTITYDTDGGSISGERVSYTAETDTFTLVKPTRFGYTFIGWSGTDVTDKQETVTITSGSVGNRSYKANWKANEYIITLNVNGGNILDDNTIEVVFDQSFILPIPECQGYEFNGWYYNDNTLVEAGEYDDYDKSIELKAKWTPRTDITYVVNHYKQNANDDGYMLESTQNLTGTADASITPSVKNYTYFISPSTKTVTIASDGSLVVDYYYDRVTYDLTYVTNGGETIEKQTYKYDQTLVIETPTRAGYTFGGWFTDETLGVTYTATPTLNEDTAIYAYWTEENKPTDFTYSGTSAITINAYNGSKKNMVIPAYIGGKPVVSIGKSAFSGKTTILSVIMPDTITTVGDSAFYNCSSMTSLRFSNNLQSVSDSMCYKCTSLTEINIPDSVTKIYSDGFRECTTLKKVILGKGVTDIYSGAFFIYTNSVSEVHITDLEAFCKINYKHGSAVGGTPINSGAMLYVNGELLTDLVIPESITEVKDWFGFRGYTALKSITFHDKVTSIGSYTFDDCSNLEIINLGNGVTSIGTCAFSNGSKLSTIIGGGNIERIDFAAFHKCTGLTSFVIGEKMAYIGVNAFYGCSNMTSVTFEDPSVWYVSSDTKTQQLTEDNLRDSSTAAKYIRSSYVGYTWEKE